MSSNPIDYDGYSFSAFPSEHDRRVFAETHDEKSENSEMNMLGRLTSTKDIEENFELTENADDDIDDSDEIKPEEFGLRPDTQMKNIYCDKMELYEEIRKYQKDNNPTDKLGEMLIKIALHMSTMARFWRYTHSIKQEIVEHAIYQMLISVPKFNLKDKKKNPFGYLSMICYRDMLHTLKKHFKQDKIAKMAKEVHMRRLTDSVPCDERLSALKQLLERNAEYSSFVNEEKVSKGQKSKSKDVDMFAISRKDQVKYAKRALKNK